MRCSPSGRRLSTWVTCAVLIALFVVPPVSSEPARKSQSDKHTKDVVFEKEFSLGKDGNLLVDVEDIDVYIETNTIGKTNVVVYVSGSDRDKAVEYFDKMRFEAQLAGTTLEINSGDPEHEGWNTWFGSRHPRVWMIVSLSPNTNIEIETEDGDVQVANINGDATVNTEDGDIEIAEIRGASIEIRTEDGDVEAESLQGADVSIETEDGDIDVESVKAEHLRIHTDDGDVILSRVESVTTNIKTDDGDLEIAVAGDQLDISCVDGDIDVSLLNAMAADIELDDGDLDLTIPKNTGFDLDLGGGDVTIRTKLAIEGRVSDDSLRGSVNDGGPLVRVVGNDGSIVLREK